jgi:hypothetical protein
MVHEKKQLKITKTTRFKKPWRTRLVCANSEELSGLCVNEGNFLVLVALMGMNFLKFPLCNKDKKIFWSLFA